MTWQAQHALALCASHASSCARFTQMRSCVLAVRCACSLTAKHVHATAAFQVTTRALDCLDQFATGTHSSDQGKLAECFPAPAVVQKQVYCNVQGNPTPPAPPASSGGRCKVYDQCGGENGKATCSKCPRGSECVIVNKWYHQCRPKGNKPSTPMPTMPPRVRPVLCRLLRYQSLLLYSWCGRQNHLCARVMLLHAFLSGAYFCSLDNAIVGAEAGAPVCRCCTHL